MLYLLDIGFAGASHDVRLDSAFIGAYFYHLGFYSEFVEQSP